MPTLDNTTTAPPGPITYAQVAPYLDAQGLPARAIEYVRRAIESNPSRLVGVQSNRAVRARYTSTTTRLRLQAESRGIELVFLIEQDLAADVVLVLDQPPPIQLRRVKDSRRTHVSAYVPDYLIVSKGAVRLVECKPHDKLVRMVAADHPDWRQDGSRFSFMPAIASAREMGLDHVTVTNLTYTPSYCANLELLSDILNKPVDAQEALIIGEIVEYVGERPASAADITSCINGATLQLIAKALVQRSVFGLLRSFPLSVEHAHRFMLYSTLEDAQLRESEVLASRNCDDASQLIDSVRNPLLTASVSALECATRIQAGYLAAERGERAFSRHERRFKSEVEAARLAGRSELTVFLPKYAKRGNRTRRIAEQLAIVEAVIQDRILIASPDNVSQALGELDLRLEKAGLPKISLETFRREVNRHSPEARKRAQQGVRGGNPLRAATDPRDRHTRALAPGLIVHADSTPADNRAWAEVGEILGLYRPKIAVAVDECSARPMAVAFSLGTSSRYLTALLIRDYARRHGYLPRFWFVDRGPEYQNNYFEDLHRVYHINCLDRPTADPRFGQVVENLVKQINYQVLRRVAGSSANDVAGRSSDGSKKSRFTARHGFQILRTEVQDYLFGIHSDTPQGTASASPRAIYESGRQQFTPGVTVDVASLEFLICTAVPIEKKDFSWDPVVGLRYGYSAYTSEEVLTYAATDNVIEARIDPEDSRLCYVRFSKCGWAVTRNSRYNELSILSADERYFEGLFIGHRAAENRDARREAHRRNAERIARIEASRPAHAPVVLPEPTPAPSAVSERAPAPKALTFATRRGPASE